MNKNLNLVEILKDAPKGTKLYSTVHGEVQFVHIYPNPYYPIEVGDMCDHDTISFTADGKLYVDYDDAECILFPSKEQRDWSKFVPPLKEGAPVMVSDCGIKFSLRYYTVNEKNSTYENGYKDGDTCTWEIIIPFGKFDPNDIEESLKYNIVK